MKLPYSKFYWRDWIGDPALRLCSYAARGLWADMLCLMGMNEGRRGYGEKNTWVQRGHARTHGVYPEGLLARLAYGERRLRSAWFQVRELVKAKGYAPDLGKEMFELADWIIESLRGLTTAKPVHEKEVAEGLQDLQRSSNGDKWPLAQVLQLLPSLA